MAELAALGLYAKAGLSGLWRFLCHRSFWQLVSLALLALASVEYAQINGVHVWPFQLRGLADKLTDCQNARTKDRQTLQSISTAKNVQHEVTTRTVEKVIQGQRQIQTIVRVIHDAPNPPDCKTPALDQLRSAV